MQLRKRVTAEEEEDDDDASGMVMDVQRQASHTPVVGTNASPASDGTRPLSFVLAFPDETCGGVIAHSNNGQVLHCLMCSETHEMHVYSNRFLSYVANVNKCFTEK